MTAPKPLASKPTIRRGPKPAYDWYTVAGVLIESPGVWHEIRTTRLRTNDVQRIKRGLNPAFRGGHWDAMDEQTTEGFVLYAVYEGPDHD